MGISSSAQGDQGSEPDPLWNRGGQVASAIAGPVIILCSVTFGLRGFVFHPFITRIHPEHPDILTMWLPRFAFLGRSLASGHVPLWNPFEMAGYRFASDPQSGWLYAPAMLFFSLLNPGLATRALIVLNPLLLGLGLYAFLRSEGLSRPTATGGGLSAAMAVSASHITIELPFAGTLAWTAVMMLGASGYRHATRWSRRLVWLGLGAFGWSQVASAHLSHGLIQATVLVVAYLAAASIFDVRQGKASTPAALGRAVLFISTLPLASLAVLVPRIAFIASSSLHGGYGGDHGPIATEGVWAGWPFAFGSDPGAYVGSVILLATPLALRARRWRHLTWAFGAALAVTYALTTSAVVTLRWYRRLATRVPFGTVLLHDPERFRYLAVIGIPVLGAVGIQGLLDAPLSGKSALAWLGAGSILWVALPLALGTHPARLGLLMAAAIAAAPILWVLATRSYRWALIGAVAVLATELLVSSELSAHAQFPPAPRLGLEGGALYPPPKPLEQPTVSQDVFLAAPTFVDTLRGTYDRYLDWLWPNASQPNGYLNLQSPRYTPALLNGRGTLFGVHDSLGYNPVQLPRYWTFIRAIQPNAVRYNVSLIAQPSLNVMRLLDARYLIVRSGSRPPLPGTVIARTGGFDLVQVDGWEHRVSVVPDWSVVSTSADAFTDVARQSFDSARTAVLEQEPGPTPELTQHQGSASYAERDPENVIITVDAPSPSIVVVRTVYDPGWTATVDGAPVPVLPTDFLIQGIPVTAGHHQILLTYRDRAVTAGVRASAVAWFALLGSALAATVVERRRTPHPVGATPVKVQR
jgi:hypothetical protein